MKNTFKCIADCDMCGLCTVFKGKDPELAYDDYICGRREYMDVSDDYKQNSINVIYEYNYDQLKNCTFGLYYAYLVGESPN